MLLSYYFLRVTLGKATLLLILTSRLETSAGEQGTNALTGQDIKIDVTHRSER